MTKSRGGASPYRKGAAFEREWQKRLEEAGWLVVRQPKSQSPFDLLAIWSHDFREEWKVYLIQCKLAGKLPKKEREELLAYAFKFNISPVLATKDGLFLWNGYTEKWTETDYRRI